MVTVAGYVRVPTERQAESHTIEQQVERLSAYAPTRYNVSSMRSDVLARRCCTEPTGLGTR
jgi:DNA invertase Pin-like site-specific DNA recombinase